MNDKVLIWDKTVAAHRLQTTMLGNLEDNRDFDDIQRKFKEK